jgi:hypothetical protein
MMLFFCLMQMKRKAGSGVISKRYFLMKLAILLAVIQVSAFLCRNQSIFLSDWFCYALFICRVRVIHDLFAGHGK